MMHHGEIMVLLIIAMVLGARVYRDRLGAAGRRRDDGNWEQADPALRAENARLSDELRGLKQRVATLERIATDGSSALDREIEALRDRP